MKSEPDGKTRVQWRAGNAETVDTGTGTTDATPTSNEGVSADADSRPSLFSFMKMPEPVNLPLQEGMTTIPAFTADKPAYLVKLTDEQVAEVHPVTPGPYDTQEDREKRQREEAWDRLKSWVRIMRDSPGALRKVIILHSPSEWGECQGCDGGPDYSGDWPCRTIELIQEEY